MLINFEISILGLIGTIIFGFASKKQPGLIKWFSIFILSSIGMIFNFLSNFFKELELIVILLYTVAIIIVSYIIFKEYRITFPKTEKFKPLISISIIEISIAVGMLSLAVVILFIDLVLQIKIASKKNSLTDRFICLILVGALMTILGNIFINLEVEGAKIVNNGIDLFFSSTLFSTGIVAILENKIRKSERKYQKAYDRSSFYKDLISHDLNNILHNIRISSEIIEAFTKEHEKLEIIGQTSENIINQIDRGSNLIKNIQQIAKIEDSNINLEEIDILLVLNKCVNYIQKSYQNEDIKISLYSELKDAIIKGNDLIYDVFENVIYNAIKHNINKKKIIRIEIEKLKQKEQSYYQILFKDNGVGIPDERKNEIFQRNIYKKSNSQGLGFGLSLVKKIITLYNGNVWVEDKVKGDYKKGSNFVILLPTFIE